MSRRHRRAAPQTYPIPVACLHGSLADMLFADALYYFLACQGETNRAGHRYVELTYKELQEQVDLTRKTLRKLLDQASSQPEPFQLVEEDGIRPHARLLKFTNYKAQFKQGKTVQKPYGFVQNSWAWVLAQPYPTANKASRFPLAIVNWLFRRPAGQTMPLGELMVRIKKPRAKKLPDKTQVLQALLHLIQLGIIEEAEAEEYRLLRNQFTTDARTAWARLVSTPPPDETAALLAWANEQDPIRAKLAQELANLGNFELTTHLKEIFYDIGQLRMTTDLHWLRYAVHRHRLRPPNPQRWHNCWSLFENKLQQLAQGVRSTKQTLTLRESGRDEVRLQISSESSQQHIRWGKLVVWVNDKRYRFAGVGHDEAVQVTLKRHDNIVWQRSLTYEDSVVRCDLTAVFQQHGFTPLTLTATAKRPLRHLSLAAQLEAELLPTETAA